MPKQKINDPGAHHASSGALIRRFLPYLVKYKKTLFLDLFCAALTTLCDIVLPRPKLIGGERAKYTEED